MPRNVHPTPFIIHPSDEISKNIDLRNLSRSLATKYADGHVVTDDDLQIMGRMLWNALGVENEFDAAQKEAGTTILSVIIESDRPEVQAYPWETLYHPAHKFIGRNPAFTLTRRIAKGKPAQATLDKGPLRVLLFTSLPDNVDAEKGRLNVEEEQAQVQEALLPWIAQGVVQLEMPDDGRFSTLKELLGRFDPHVLFLSGHGKFHHEPHADEAYGTFWFESETGDGESIRDEEIAQALAETRVQAVILSACESGKAASDYLSNGLMQRISAAGVPHVIGMRESILDVAGIQFEHVLCDALAERERMGVALQSARAAIQNATDERGQWCLPMALSAEPQSPLIDWDFQPQAIQPQRINQRLNNVSLPARFVGRRAERRKFQSKLTQGALRRLLITGAGGQGKTALAGKLALDMQAHGWKVFAWNAEAEKSWSGFELEELFNSLETFRQDRLKEAASKQPVEMERARSVLKELSEQFDGRVVLFLDNLETLQDAETFEIKDETIAAWLSAAGDMDGVTVLATSRNEIPHWTGEIFAGLAGVKYGDFLQIAMSKNLYIRRDQMFRVWKALGGNIRGLEFFDAALKELSVPESDELLEKLERIEEPLEDAKQKLQANMAIAEIYSRLPEDAKKLLARLPAYHEPVPMEGLLKLGEGLPDSEKLLERLLAVSLLEASYEPHWKMYEYQCTPITTGWMNENGLIAKNLEWLNAAAEYYLDLLEHSRNTLPQAIATHHALRRAKRHDDADLLTLNYIADPMTLAGFYASLLSNWIPRICESKDLETRARAMHHVGILYFRSGNYISAISYYEQSLTIAQQIGNKERECVTLAGIGTSYLGQGEYEIALEYLKKSLAVSQQIGDKANEGAVLGSIGTSYLGQGEYEIALEYLKKSLAVSQQIGDKANEGATLSEVSQIFYSLGDLDVSLDYLKKSLAIQQLIGDKGGEGTSLHNISQNYYARGDYATELDYLKQALVIRQKIGDKLGEGRTLCNIGRNYLDQGNFDVAYNYLKQSLAIQQKIGDKTGEGGTLNNISQIFMAQDNFVLALDYLKQSLAIQQQIGDKAGLCATLFNIGHIYAQNEKIDDAINSWLDLYLIAKQINFSQALQALANLASQIGLPNGLDGWEQLTQRKRI